MEVAVTRTPPEVALARILEALEAELTDASEEEIIAAIGMKAAMRGSAALLDLKYSEIRRHLDALYGASMAEPEAEEDDISPGTHLPGARPHDR